MKLYIKVLLVIALVFGNISSSNAVSLLPNYTPTFTRTLKVGTKGEDVKTLQRILSTKSFFTDYGDGYFGPITKKAVINFQIANNLTPDGIAGPKTHLALINAFISSKYLPGCTSTEGFSTTTGFSCSTPPADIVVKPVDKYSRYVGDGCKIADTCNGPISCIDQNAELGGSICMYSPEFTCYKESTVRCEKQSSGRCDWTQTTELKSCIDKNK